ncbi:unnamed protein product [Adineta steineri]|uniref:Protein kinase domain-containing protein n=1 Tax=Adineta steineri TaxID=433720 RepID=A0A813TST8_9BILA|nr:unnamed protein product [Adineta steineri]CAF3637764.1 unnamed protein product [Adineta steineri]
MGLPIGTTAESLKEKLGERAKGQYVILRDETSTLASSGTIGYLREQSSEKLAKKFIKHWKNKEYFPGFILKYQLEIDNNDIDNDDIVNSSMIDSPQDGDFDDGDLTQDGFTPSQGSIKEDNQFGSSQLSAKEDYGSAEPTGLPDDVPRRWKRFQKETKTGGEGEVIKICPCTGKKTTATAAIKVYKYDTILTRKMRAYREKTAMKKLKDLSNVSHLYPSETDLVTNIPENFSDITNENDYKRFWMIMTLIEGFTLKEYVTQRYNHKKGFTLLDALTLTEKLLAIVKDIHQMGIVHRDLKLDNIMIVFEKYNDSTDKAQVFVIDFGLSYIETQEDIEIDWSKYDQEPHQTELEDSIGNRWYRVPQLDRQDVSRMTNKQKNDLFHVIRRSRTIDASSICAILFWMLTRIVPETNRDNKNLAPHQKNEKEIKNKIGGLVSTMTDLPNEARDTLTKQLELYLMTTFDKGFEFPERQWTIEQLDFRLQLIRNTLKLYSKSSATIKTLEDISKALANLDDTGARALSSSYESKSPLNKAASAFHFAKTKFIENHRSNYKWADESCQWLDDNQNLDERKHYDILTYYFLNRNWSIIICCTANVNEQGQSVHLSIGSIVHGLYIGIPIGEYPTNGILDKNDIYIKFERELKNLILLLYKRKAQICE